MLPRRRKYLISRKGWSLRVEDSSWTKKYKRVWQLTIPLRNPSSLRRRSGGGRTEPPSTSIFISSWDSSLVFMGKTWWTPSIQGRSWRKNLAIVIDQWAWKLRELVEKGHEPSSRRGGGTTWAELFDLMCHRSWDRQLYRTLTSILSRDQQIFQKHRVLMTMQLLCGSQSTWRINKIKVTYDV